MPFCLFLGAKIAAQNLVGKFGLILPRFFRIAPNMFSIIILNDDRLVVFRECPEAHVTIKATALASRALGVVTLLTQWLPVVVVTGSTARTWDSMIGGKFDRGFRLSAVGTFVITFGLQRIPKIIGRFCARFALRRYLCGDQLIFRSFFDDTGKTFFTLQFTHSAERVNVWLLPSSLANIIDYLPNFNFTYLRAWNSVSIGPKFMKQNSIDFFQSGTGSDKPSYGIVQPFFSSLRIGNWVSPRGQQ